MAKVIINLTRHEVEEEFRKAKAEGRPVQFDEGWLKAVMWRSFEFERADEVVKKLRLQHLGLPETLAILLGASGWTGDGVPPAVEIAGNALAQISQERTQRLQDELAAWRDWAASEAPGCSTDAERRDAITVLLAK